ncbi:MAG: Panacea domain-containing protein [Coleofasciculaceae cyanobacterium]
MSDSITFKLDPLKAVQVAAMFLKLHGGRMEFLTLLKLMYKADRVAFEKIDKPVTGDKYVSMNKGPVLSGVYDLIKDNQKYQKTDVWKRYISTRNDSSNHEVRLLEDPGFDELSEEEEEIIKDAYKEWGRLNRFDIVALTHDFPEWKNPHGSSIPIDVIDILKNVGKTQEEIDYIRKIAAREIYLDRFLDE